MSIDADGVVRIEEALSVDEAPAPVPAHPYRRKTDLLRAKSAARATRARHIAHH